MGGWGGRDFGLSVTSDKIIAKQAFGRTMVMNTNNNAAARSSIFCKIGS